MRKYLSLMLLMALAAPAAFAMERMGEGGPTNATKSVSDEAKKALTALLPPDAFYDDLKAEPVVFYDAANLYEYIDGQAEGYIGYEFKALAAATYTHGDDMLVVDIYDMGKPLNAFGVYSTFRAPENDFLEIGEQGFRMSDGVMFWKGRYAVKVAADFLEEADMTKAAEAAARAVAAKIPADRSGLELLDVLPRANRVANSEKYLREAVMGQVYLTNGVLAQYKLGVSTGRLFVADLGTPEAAKAAYDKYLAFAKANATNELRAKEGVNEFTADVKYYGTSTVFQDGRFVAGLVGFAGGCECLLEPLRDNLKAANAKSAAKAEKP